jgi:hypothetical protein
MNWSKSAFVYIEWVDSTATTGWQPVDTSGPDNIVSVGLLVTHDKENVVISTSRCSSGKYLDQLTIPRSCIKRIRGMKGGEK